MIEIKIKPERENFQMPVMGSEEAACYDAYVSKIEEQSDGLVICYLGFSTEIPKGYKAVLVARSNITKYGWVLANGVGIIDSDFRNEWQARFRRTPVYSGEKGKLEQNEEVKIWMQHQSHQVFPYKVGERVAQFSIEKVNEMKLNLVSETTDSERGLGGFGSSGKK